MLVPINPYAYTNVSRLGGVKKPRLKIKATGRAENSLRDDIIDPDNNSLSIEPSEFDRRLNGRRKRSARRRYQDKRLHDTRCAQDRRHRERRAYVASLQKFDENLTAEQVEGVFLDLRV
jgi:hypothetical protein